MAILNIIKLFLVYFTPFYAPKNYFFFRILLKDDFTIELLKISTFQRQQPNHFLMLRISRQ